MNRSNEFYQPNRIWSFMKTRYEAAWVTNTCQSSTVSRMPLFYSDSIRVRLRSLFSLVFIPMEFWRNTVSCIQPFRSLSMKYLNVRELPKENCTFAKPSQYTLSSFLNSTVMVTDCRLPDVMIYTKENKIRLQANRVMKDKETVKDLQRILFRLLLNPIPPLQDMINSFKQKHYTKKNVFAIQIRMGGCLSDSPEMMEMMSSHELKQLPSVIKNAMASWNYTAANTDLFLSTDSVFAETYIRNALGSMYTVLTSDAFHRGHTTGNPNAVAVGRALIDLFLLADSDALLYCYESGFGTVAKMMGRAQKVIEYRVTHRLIPNFNSTVSCGMQYALFVLNQSYRYSDYGLQMSYT